MSKSVSTPLTKKTVQQLFNFWSGPLCRGENALILAAPRMDRSYRIPEFIHFLSNSYDVHVMSLLAEKTEDIDDWNRITALKQSSSKMKRCFLIPDAELLFQDRKHLLVGLATHYLQTKIPFLLFTEVNPYQGLLQVFAQNRIFHALYGQEDVAQFISYLEKKYGGTVSMALRKQVVEKTGGHLWLIKEAVRHSLFQKSEDPLDHDDMWWRVGEIYKGLLTRERDVLQDIILQKPIKDTEAQMYLKKTGVINNAHITIGLLEDFIKKQLRKQTQVSIKNGSICIGDVVVDAALSKREKAAILCILSGHGDVVPREFLGKTIWGKDGDFTDWALDQLVKRVRKKLATFGVPAQCIQTVKGKGYYVSS